MVRELLVEVAAAECPQWVREAFVDLQLELAGGIGIACCREVPCAAKCADRPSSANR